MLYHIEGPFQSAFGKLSILQWRVNQQTNRRAEQVDKGARHIPHCLLNQSAQLILKNYWS